MHKTTELHIRKIIREVLSESLILEISAEEKSKAMGKSGERVPFSTDLMKQAITQGREVGILFRTNNKKETMPVAKYRIVHPVAIGTSGNGEIIYRALHVTGQSEKVARKTGNRSAEADSERDGINAWRLFKAGNTRSMWFTGRFFSDNIPGFNPNDKAMSSKIAVYNPELAKQYQSSFVTKAPIEVPSEVPTSSKDIDQLGYEDNLVKEKNNVRSLFK